eukprot:1178552-Prorocentrum_minimum.AAC.3
MEVKFERASAGFPGASPAGFPGTAPAAPAETPSGAPEGAQVETPADGAPAPRAPRPVFDVAATLAAARKLVRPPNSCDKLEN